MSTIIEIIQLLAALSLTLAGLALVAGFGGAARTLGRWGAALLLVAFLLPTILGLILLGVRRTRDALPTFGETGSIGWCSGSMIVLGHISFSAWYLTRERKALARRADGEEARRVRTRERERLPAPPSTPGGTA